MARQFSWILAGVLLFAPAMTTAEGACEAVFCGQDQKPQGSRSGDKDNKDKKDEDRRPGFVKWWDVPEHRAELGIGDQQAARIEQIFQEHLPAQRERYRELQRLEPALAQLIKEGTADPAIVAREVDRVENLTAEVRKSRIVTLYRMHRELTAEQRAKLKAIYDRREADHRKSSDSARRR
jgi:Spy/CpxP family protein refolding chaperone